MFQNINEYTVQDNKKEVPSKWAEIIKKNNIIMYIISFMLSLVGIGGEFSLFSISILGACFSSSIPLLGIVISGVVGNIIKFGVAGGLEYFLTSLVFFITIFIIKPRYNEEERNEKIKVGRNLFIAVLIIQVIKSMLSVFTIYDILLSITYAILAFVFYKIFINSLTVIENFGQNTAFSIEEVIGTSLLLAIAASAFSDLSILGFSIRNILSILIVLVLGWKNGVLVGATSGVTIGVTLGIITGGEPIIIAAYAISGMIAGVLNRFGKIGVIIGFCIGNVVLAYVSNGYTVELIYFKEILLASIILLAIPKNVKIDIEEFVGGSKFLPISRERSLTKEKETVEKLNNVSEAIKKMANTYNKDPENEFNIAKEKEENKQIFIDELLNNLEPYKDNLLYEDISNVNGKIIDEIFKLLLEKQEIERKELLQIFADCNSYIVGFDDKEISGYLEENILQILRIINISYKISKNNFIWKIKLEESKKNMETQLRGVSKVISGIAKEIEKDSEKEQNYTKQEVEIIELLKQKGIEVDEISIDKKDRYIVNIFTKTMVDNDVIENILSKVLKEKIILNEDNSTDKSLIYISDDKYVIGFASSHSNKDKSEISGDNFINIRLKDGKYLIALSDGIGTGKKANESSLQALTMLQNLLASGFDKNSSIELITSSLISKNEEIFATLDVAIIDLYKGTIEFIKSGACPTYIKKNKRVQIIKSNSLPAGMINQDNIQVFDTDIQNGQIMLMCTDGILDSNIEYKNKELWVKYLLEDIDSKNTKKIADIILNEAIDNNFGKTKDDMSVIVCKFMQKDI
mgnify:FL=1